MSSRSLLFASLMVMIAACADSTAPGASHPGLARGGHGGGGGGGGGGNSDVAVTSTLTDGSYSLQSDASGPYTNSSSLMSVIQPIGAWVLDTKSDASRTVSLDLGEGSPVPAGQYAVRILANCPLYGTGNTMQGVPVDGSIECPLHIAFDYNGASYALQMNPVGNGAGEAYPETESALVTCTAGSASSCSAWHITPTAEDGSNVAALLRFDTVHHKQVTTKLTDVSVSFDITVTLP
jgi:hypothetical protein